MSIHDSRPATEKCSLQCIEVGVRISCVPMKQKRVTAEVS